MLVLALRIAMPCHASTTGMTVTSNTVYYYLSADATITTADTSKRSVRCAHDYLDDGQTLVKRLSVRTAHATQLLPVGFDGLRGVYPERSRRAPLNPNVS